MEPLSASCSRANSRGSSSTRGCGPAGHRAGIGELKLLGPEIVMLSSGWVRTHCRESKNCIRGRLRRTRPPNWCSTVGTASGAAAPVVAMQRHPMAGVERRSPKAVGLRRLVLGGPINSGLSRHLRRGKEQSAGQGAAISSRGEPGEGLHPLFIYGGVGLGKTHLMHASPIRSRKTIRRRGSPTCTAKDSWAICEACSTTPSTIQDAYRSLDALMIDDISFRWKRALPGGILPHLQCALESQQQVILTAIGTRRKSMVSKSGCESRFGWGLTVAIERRNSRPALPS